MGRHDWRDPRSGRVITLGVWGGRLESGVRAKPKFAVRSRIYKLNGNPIAWPAPDAPTGYPTGLAYVTGFKVLLLGFSPASGIFISKVLLLGFSPVWNF